MSDYIQVPLQSLRDIANNLAGMKADLEGDKKGADLLSGVDSIHGHKIQQAVAEYFGEWDGPRNRLLENVGKLGDVSGKIADVTQQYDDESAKGFNQFAAKLRGKE